MRKCVLPGLFVSLMATMSVALCVGPAVASETPAMSFEGGPVMSSYNTVEVVWSHAGTSAEATMVSGIAGFLSDVAAASGTTNNVFSTLAQYSTSGLTSNGNVAAYNSKYLGSASVEPITGEDIQASQLATTLDQAVEARVLPRPTVDGNGVAQTNYVLMMPPNVEVCLEGTCSGPKHAEGFCSFHDSSHYGSTPYTFSVILDLSGGLSSGCGTSVTKLNNETSNVTHQIAESVTDPMIEESLLGWYKNGSADSGEVADYCDTAGGEATNTINGKTWTVQKIWSNLDNACVASDSYFKAPTADFTAAPTQNTAAFSASGSSTNHISGISAGIANYSWDFGDGQSGSGANPTHAYSAAGTYTVTVTATDTLGFTAHATHEVSVSAPPAPPPSTGGGSSGGASTGGTTTSGTGSANGTPGTGTVTEKTKASIASAGGASTSSAGGSVLVNSGETVQCPPTGGLCVVSMQGEVETAHLPKSKAKNRKVKVGTATLTVSPGGATKVSFKLNGAGRKLLQANGKLLVKLTVTVQHGSDAPVVSTHTITIKAPKKAHGHKR